MESLTSVFPRPRLVQCGDETIKVSEFRLRDLVSLQEILDDMTVDPLASIQDGLDLLPRKERHAAIVAAYEAAESGSPVYGEPNGKAFYATPAGNAALLWVAIRRWKYNRATAKRAGELYSQSSPSQFSHIWRICHGVSSLRTLQKMLTFPLPSQHNPQGVRDWGEMIDILSEKRNWTYEYILSLPITQWVRVNNEGKIPERVSLYNVPREQWGELNIKFQRYYAGEIDEHGNEFTD